MNLTNEEKIAKRQEILQQLIHVPNGQRIKIDKDLLESLIFEKDITTDGKPIKFVVWSGEFLSKIDLSEISFDDVQWNIKYFKKKELRGISGNDYYKDIECINLSNTNVKIDFDNSFNNKVEKNKFQFISIGHLYKCNFENVDLSESNLKDMVVRCCNFRNCNLNLNNEFLGFYEILLAGKCDFSENDLSQFTIDWETQFNRMNNLTNTGIHIKADAFPASEEEIEKIIYLLNETEKLNGNKKSNELQTMLLCLSSNIDRGRFYLLRNLKKAIEGGLIEGCYVNDVFIDSTFDSDYLNINNSLIDNYKNIKKF